VFAKVQVPIIAFSGVDAQALNFVPEQSLVTRGILANWKSHEKLLQQIAEGSDEVVLILEDDAVPNGDVNWRLLLDRAPKVMDTQGIGYLQLGFVSWQFRFTRPGITELTRSRLYSSKTSSIELDKSRKIVFGSALSGAHAYIVTREFARKIANVNNPCWTSSDGLYMRMSSMSGTDNIFPIMSRLKKSIVEQESRTKRLSVLDSDVM